MKPEWLLALAGGGLIGLAVSIMLLWNGRVTGVSGIIAGLLLPQRGDWKWRAGFMIGLVSGGALAADLFFIPWRTLDVPRWTIPVAGVFVGFGTVLGSGCTSGHGVCGISRMSPRSLLATIIFILAGIISVVFWKKIGVLP